MHKNIKQLQYAKHFVKIKENPCIFKTCFSTAFSKPETHPGDVAGRTGSITTFNVVIIVVVDQTLKTSAVLFIYFMQKNPSHLTRFEHFAAVDRPQPLYDRFTGKLAPSTLLLVNVLTEKDVDHVFAKKKIRGNTGITEVSIYMFSLSSSPVSPPTCFFFTFKSTGNFLKEL